MKRQMNIALHLVILSTLGALYALQAYLLDVRYKMPGIEGAGLTFAIIYVRGILNSIVLGLWMERPAITSRSTWTIVIVIAALITSYLLGHWRGVLDTLAWIFLGYIAYQLVFKRIAQQRHA